MTEFSQIDKIKIITKKDKNIEKYLKSARNGESIEILDCEYRVINIEIMELSKGKTAFIDLVEVVKVECSNKSFYDAIKD